MQTILFLTLTVVACDANAERGSDDDAVVALRKLGARVVVDETQPNKPVISIAFRTKITDESLDHVKRVSHLQKLDLRGTQITDAGLVKLKELNSLQELILNARGELHLFSKLFLNGDLLDRDALDTPVSGDDTVAVIAPAAGG